MAFAGVDIQATWHLFPLPISYGALSPVNICNQFVWHGQLLRQQRRYGHRLQSFKYKHEAPSIWRLFHRLPLLHLFLCSISLFVCRTAQEAEEIWGQTFKYLADNKVLFEGMLLKPSMVTPGADSGKKVCLITPTLGSDCCFCFGCLPT